MSASRRQLLEELDRQVGDSLPRALLDVAVETRPHLVAAELVARPVRHIADVVIGDACDIGVAERRAPLDVDPQLREVLPGDAYPGDVADPERLHPGRPLLALLLRQGRAH